MAPASPFARFFDAPAPAAVRGGWWWIMTLPPKPHPATMIRILPHNDGTGGFDMVVVPWEPLRPAE